MSIKTDTTLDKVVATIGDLPASPSIVSAVMGLTSNLDSRVNDISRVLAADQSLTAKVLRLSNSSYYGRPKEVATLEEAITLLGFHAVRSIVIATSAHNLYVEDDPDGSKGKLWRHSLSTAVAARQIAQRLRHPEKEEVFIAALLHDIGKLVLIEKLTSQYRRVIAETEATHGRFHEIETGLLGFTHTDVAQVLLQQWSFPSGLTEAVERHHQLPEIPDGRALPMAYIINLANSMAKSIADGFSDHRPASLSELASVEAMPLDADALTQITAEAAEYYEVETSIFDE